MEPSQSFEKQKGDCTVWAGLGWSRVLNCVLSSVVPQSAPFPLPQTAGLQAEAFSVRVLGSRGTLRQRRLRQQRARRWLRVPSSATGRFCPILWIEAPVCVLRSRTPGLPLVALVLALCLWQLEEGADVVRVLALQRRGLIISGVELHGDLGVKRKEAGAEGGQRYLGEDQPIV